MSSQIAAPDSPSLSNDQSYKATFIIARLLLFFLNDILLVSLL